MSNTRPHSFFRLLAILSIVGMALMGCTDRRKPLPQVQAEVVVPGTNGPPQTLVPVADIRFNGQDLNVWTLQAKGDSLYTTGTPYGFMKMAINNPTSPQLIFAVAEQTDRLFPRWVAPWYARGALAILGQNAFMSGTVGVSVINFSETNRPKEVNRDPDYDDNAETVTADDAKIWSAAAFHPTQAYLYAFRQSDFVYTYRVNGSQLALQSKSAYSDDGDGTCCANAATVFNNQLYVAFRTRLVFFGMSNNGALVNARQYVGLQANTLASTPNNLYIGHEGSFDVHGGTQFPRGVYVFNRQGKNIGYLPVNPTLFAVSQNDSHIYVVGPEYSNGAVIRVMRIVWNQQ